MPVLKSTSPAASPQAFSLRDIEKQAAAILARARQQADALLAEAQAAGEQLRRQGYDRGLAEGRMEGERQGREQGAAAGKNQAFAESKAAVAALIQTLSAAAGEFEKSRHELLAGAETDLLRLALEIARKVVHGFAAAHPSVASGTLAEALKFVIEHNDLKIRVHPSQRDLLLEALPALSINWPALKHVQIVADETIAPGGTVLLTRHGQVDATLNGMIDRIAAEILGGRERPGAAA